MNQLIEDLRQLILKKQLLVIVGTGVSIAASGRNPVASWPGLLRNGIARCQGCLTELPNGWDRAVGARIDSGDLIGAADEVFEKLSEPEFRRWLRETVGQLKLMEPDLVQAIRDLQCPIATTNYDSLLEQSTGRQSVNWLDTWKVERVLRGDEEGILHLHGYWEHPSSIVFSRKSYEQVLGNPHAQGVLHGLRFFRSLLFIGFGAGLTDPNFGELLQWMGKVFSTSEYRDYRLATNGEAAEFRKQQPSDSRIFVLPYGDRHDELGSFIRKLCPGARIEPSASFSSTSEFTYSNDTSVAQPDESAQQLRKALQDLADASKALELEQNRRQLAEAQAVEEAELRRQLSSLLVELPHLALDQSSKTILTIIKRAADLAVEIQIDESTSRHEIDKQLVEYGWVADSERFTYAKGVRPESEKNIAIANWPSTNGTFDYVLFVGLRPLGVIESKRRHGDLPTALEYLKVNCNLSAQSNLFARLESTSTGGAAVVGQGPFFLFATNGRLRNHSFPTKGGVWFLDARHPANRPRPLAGWYSPPGLLHLLSEHVNDAESRLRVDPLLYLREYQKEAIRAIEMAIYLGKRECLVAMATGTGKLHTCASLIGRLISCGRFRRILFLVESKALAEQSISRIRNLVVGDGQKLEHFFQIEQLSNKHDASRESIHTFNYNDGITIATAQSAVNFLSNNLVNSSLTPVDRFDCVVFFDCDTILNTIGNSQMTQNSNILFYFDAVKIAFTSMPTLGATRTFGPPLFEYGFADAVRGGYLVGHEFIRMTIGNVSSGFIDPTSVKAERVQSAYVADEVSDVSKFEKTLQFHARTQLIVQGLVTQLDPNILGKVVVFCSNIEHAHRVASDLKSAMSNNYQNLPDDYIMEITSATENQFQLIRKFRHERYPRIAVGVDLLIPILDMPSITTLVFLRTITSRALYLKIISSASMPWPEIGEKTLRVIDAVGLDDSLIYL